MKPVYLLDTNIISELSKLKPNAAILKKLEENDGLCAISSTVWQESIYGYERMPEGKKKDFIADCLMTIKTAYPIISYDGFAAQICGEISARCAAAGFPVPKYDSQIAATAIANNMILVTHNTEDYKSFAANSMLSIEDWWE
jgi:predicted nucleic acid-binding protein